MKNTLGWGGMQKLCSLTASYRATIYDFRIKKESKRQEMKYYNGETKHLRAQGLYVPECLRAEVDLS